MSLDEELLLIENAQTNIQSFAALYDIYFPKIYSYCLNRLCNKENAEDVTSQVFLKSIEIVKSFDTKRKLRLGPWLYAIAHNLIIDTIRKNSHIVTDESALQKFQSEDGNLKMEKDAEVSIMQKQIVETLNKINERYSKIISLKFYSELETEEIAMLMDVNSSQVAVILHRALNSFREEYKNSFANSEIIYDLNS